MTSTTIRSLEFRLKATRSDRLVLFTVSSHLQKRMLTVDLWAPPTNPAEMQQWFLILVARTWWDIDELGSFVRTVHVADAMVTAMQRLRAEEQAA